MATRHLILVGGPNGAGKTTFAMKHVALRGGVYLGADAIAAEISPENSGAAAVETVFNKSLRNRRHEKAN